MRKVPRMVGSSDLASEVPTNIKIVSRGPFVGTNMKLPRIVGSSDLYFSAPKDRF
jgi:hypothetical protein